MSDPGSGAGRPRLVVDAEARPWRDLGALPWVVLCDLAASAVADAHGWMAPVGAREIGASAGLNKDTAARALAALAGAGIVTRERAEVAGARRRSGYRLHLPAGIGMCPADPDSAGHPTDPDAEGCPSGSDAGERPSNRDAGMCPRDRDAGMCPISPDSGSYLDGADAGLRPGPSDDRARRAVSDGESTSGHRHHTAGDGGAGGATDVSARQRDGHGGRVVQRGESSGGRHGAVEQLDGHQSLAESGPRRRGRDQVPRAVNEAQGQLFESAGGDIDRAAQDSPR